MCSWGLKCIPTSQPSGICCSARSQFSSPSTHLILCDFSLREVGNSTYLSHRELIKRHSIKDRDKEIPSPWRLNDTFSGILPYAIKNDSTVIILLPSVPNRQHITPLASCTSLAESNSLEWDPALWRSGDPPCPGYKKHLSDLNASSMQTWWAGVWHTAHHNVQWERRMRTRMLLPTLVTHAP